MTSGADRSKLFASQLIGRSGNRPVVLQWSSSARTTDGLVPIRLAKEPSMSQLDPLGSLFSPSAIAVVGASDDDRKFGNWISVQALRGKIPVHLVNRSRETVLGRSTAPTIEAIGAQVDLAVIAVPAASFEAAVDDALDSGVRAIVGISAGLGELGQTGRETQERVAAKVRVAGARLLGPNSLGLLDHTTGLTVASNEFPVGSVGLIFQSGNLALELASLLCENDMGVSRFASLGNQADIDAAELIEAYALHPGTSAIALYCEDFRDGRRLARAAHLASEAGKPVVLLTVGSTAASVRNARSHTGALASSQVVVDAACRAAGIEQVTSPAQMANLLQALVRTNAPRGRRVAVLSDGGGHASVASDIATSVGLQVVEFPPELQACVARQLPVTAAVGNPVDVAGGAEQDIHSFARVLDLLVKSEAVDAVLSTGYFGGYGAYGADIGALEIETAHAMVANSTGATFIVQTMNWQSPAATVLRTGGTAVYSGIDEAAWALGRLFDRQAHPPTGIPDLPPPAAVAAEPGYHASRRIIAATGIPFVPAAEVSTVEELLEAVTDLRFPLVLKHLGSEHKSDEGGVILDISDPAALLRGWEVLQERFPPAACSVEEMADLTHVVELLVGGRNDPRFGPVVLVGIGGIFTEILGDVRCALAPITPAAARDLLLSLRGSALLTGARGRPAVDIDAVAAIVAQLSTLTAEHPEIAEIECNPVAATPRGAVALDARIVLDQPGSSQQPPSGEDPNESITTKEELRIV